MKKKRLIAVICAAAVAVLSAAYTGCDNSKAVENQQDEAIVEVLYQSYVEAEAADGNNTPLSYEDWLNSIKGAKGDQGIQGEKGDDGSDGKSAYQIWLDAGNEGTEADFISFLKGNKGDKGDDGTNGINGVSVIGASIDESTHLIINLSDGTTIDAGYVGVPVSQEKQKYTVTFVADGQTVAEVKYTEGDTTVTEPQVPEKSGYTGRWGVYTLNNENITVNAVYTAIEEENPPVSETVKPEDFISEIGEEYEIRVTSEGGLQLNGVKISIYHESGTELASGVTNNGKVVFGLKSGEYTVQADVESLPEGYYLSDDVVKTSATKYKLDYKIPSKVSNGALNAEYEYIFGHDIARDFTVTGVNQSYTLSELSNGGKTVLLYFINPNSSDARNQLFMLKNAIEYASSKNSAVEILAICATGNMGDLEYCVEENRDITVPIAVDDANLVKHFGAQTSTAVVIDRYGLVAYKTTNSQDLSDLIEEYTSPDYVQKIS